MIQEIFNYEDIIHNYWFLTYNTVILMFIEWKNKPSSKLQEPILQIKIEQQFSF